MTDPSTLHTLDRWSVWFNRVSQVAGLVLVAYEVSGPENPFALLFAGAMMLGPVGLRLMLRGASGLLADAADKLEEEPPDARRD